MKNENEIYYKDIMSRGFDEDFCSDSVYFGLYGYEYAIITKKLYKRISLDWEKETRTCKIIKVDKEGFITAEMPIKNLEHLDDVISFYTDKK